MQEFKVGDFVETLTHEFYVDEEDNGPHKGDILEVVETCYSEGYWIDSRSIEVEALNSPKVYAKGKFKLHKPKSKFAVGDKVVSIINTPEVPEGYVGYIVEDDLLAKSGHDYAVRKEFTATQVEYFNEDELELLSFAPTSKKSVENLLESISVVGEEELKPTSALDKQVSGNHYKDCGIQPIEYIHANGLSYFQGNVIKYVTRYKDKAGKADLEKAIHYLELMIELEYKDK